MFRIICEKNTRNVKSIHKTICFTLITRLINDHLCATTTISCLLKKKNDFRDLWPGQICGNDYIDLYYGIDHTYESMKKHIHMVVKQNNRCDQIKRAIIEDFMECACVWS